MERDTLLWASHILKDWQQTPICCLPPLLFNVFQNYPAPMTNSCQQLLPFPGAGLLCMPGQELCKAAEVMYGTENPLRGEYSSGLTLGTPPFWADSGEQLASSKGDSEQGTDMCPAQGHGLLWGRSLSLRPAVDYKQSDLM